MCRAIATVAALTPVMWPFFFGLVIGVDKLSHRLQHKWESRK